MVDGVVPRYQLIKVLRRLSMDMIWLWTIEIDMWIHFCVLWMHS